MSVDLGNDIWIGVGLDVDLAFEQLDLVEEEQKRSAASYISTIRTGMELGVLVLQIFGQSIDQMSRATIDLIFAGIQTILTTREAYLTMGPTAAIFTGIVGLGEIAVLVGLIYAIQQNNDELQASLTPAVTAMRLAGTQIR